ncbi:hypothetical protein IW262DRAFT_1302182 [Armillaria fumosa]|nr:hypothetical protein IW262DRAFT_1302182 [Armillaria fumosa]
MGEPGKNLGNFARRVGVNKLELICLELVFSGNVEDVGNLDDTLEYLLPSVAVDRPHIKRVNIRLSHVCGVPPSHFSTKFPTYLGDMVGYTSVSVMLVDEEDDSANIVCYVRSGSDCTDVNEERVQWGCILTVAGPTIVRIQLKISIDEIVPIQSLIILRLIFRTPVSAREPPAYRCAISEDPGFIANNHDEAHSGCNGQGERSSYCQPSIRERRCLGKEMETYPENPVFGASCVGAGFLAKEERLMKKLPNVRGITRGSWL